MNGNNRLAKSWILSAILALSMVLHLALRAPAADLSGSYTWKPVKIGAGGFMRGMMVHPTNANVRFARGDVDNIYRWDNTNSTWVPMEVSSALPASVTAAPAGAGAGPIAVDPNNANVVLCGWTFLRSADIQGTNPNVNFNVYRSTNGGVTFTAGNLSLAADLSGEQRGERMMIDPSNSNVVYLGSPSNGLWRSMDGGATWLNVTANGAPTSTSNAVLPRFDSGAGTTTFSGQTVSKRIYLTMDAGPVLMSNDGGNSWTNISTGQDVDGKAGYGVVAPNGNLIIQNTANGYIDIYTRAGVWSATQPPHGATGIAVDPTNSNRIFVMGQGGSLARSLNGGTSWTDLGATLTLSATQEIQWLRPSATRPQGHFISTAGLYLDPAGKLWVPGGNDGIICATPNDSTDTAANPPVWSSASQGIEEMVGQAVTVPPGGNPIFMVEDESLFTIYNPDTFNAQHQNLNLWSNNTGLSIGQDVAYCPNQPHFVIETSDNGFYGREPTATQRFSGYSADGGTNWSVFPSIANGTHPCPLYCGLVAVSARPSGHVNDAPGADNIVWAPANVVSANPPAPFYSTDGGATWTQTHSFDAAPGASQGWRCTSWYTYLGFQWGCWTNLIHQHQLEADPLIPGTFYMDLTNGGFWKSTDGGVTWVQQTGTGLPSATHQGQLRANPNVSGDLWFVDGYEGASAHGLYHTTNGGASFTRSSAFDYAWELALGKASGSYPTIFVYGKMTGDANWGVFRSVDQGVSWDRISYYPTGMIDPPAGMAASWDNFGQVYVSFQGDSLAYGTPTGAPPIPPSPTGLTATAGNTQISLKWYSSPGSTSYSIFRGTTAGGEGGTAIAVLNGPIPNYTDTGLTNGTTYYYKVSATNASGTSGLSNEANAIPAPQPPVAPTNLIALSGDTQISLVWAAASGATTYNVYRSTTAGGETLLASGVAATNYTNTGLTNGTTYYYKVAGVNAVGTGPQSGETNAKPAAATAQIAFATTAPTIDGNVDAVWAGATSYPMPNITGTIPGGATNTGSWQALWDSTNLYVLVTMQDSTVIANNDAVEVYVDGNNAKAGAYTNVDWQYVFPNGSTWVYEYSGGSSGSNTAGVSYGQTPITGGWREEIVIPWSTIGVSQFANDDIGLDVVYSNYNVAGTRCNKLFWNSTTDNDWTNPGLFGTAKLMPGVGGIPATPTGLVATPGNAQVALTWNTSAGATSYNVSRSTISGSGYAAVSTPTVTNYTNTGLTNGTTYYFVVSATNTSGTSANSAQASATPVAPPAAPTGLTATPGDAQVALSWTASGGATTYNALRSTVSGSGYVSVATGIATTSYTNTGLTNVTTYYFVVSATNAGGTSANSAQASATPQAAIPAAPTGLAATPGDTQVALSWTASSGATSYNVLRSTVSGSGYVSVATGIAVTNYTNTGLTNGTTYYFVVTATNTAGTSPNSAQASATPQVSIPAAPTGLTATGGNTQVALSWTASAGATSYNVLRSTVSGSGYASVATGIAVTSYTNTGLTNGTAYYFVVTATNAAGTSPNSAQASATPSSTGLPAPWLDADIGAPGVAGSATYTSPTFTVNGGGSDIWNTADQFNYVYQNVTGDCSIVARVVTQQNTDPWCKAGVMIRETIAAGAANQATVMTPAQGVLLQDRPTTGANCGFAQTAGISSPQWVKVARVGNNFSSYYSNDGVSWTQVGTTTAITMAAGVTVGLCVTSHNNTVVGTATFDNVTVTSGGPPSPPTGLTATPGNAQVALSWTASSDATSYNVLMSTVSGSGYGNAAINLVPTSYTVNSLTNGTAYYFVVTATNASGTSANSAQASATPVAPPAAPTGLTATAGDAQVALSWTASGGATSYNVKRSTVSGSGYAQVTNVATTSYTNTELTNGTAYYFVVSALNAGGESANSAQASATPIAIPAAPTGLTATAGNAQVALSWTASVGATAYDVKRSTVSGSGYALVSSPTATNYTNTGLTNGTAYYFVVDAKNGSGTSADSTQASATPVAPPAAPTGLVATPGNTQVALTWNASANATAYDVKRSTVNGSGYATVSSPTVTNYTNTGLTNGTTYYFVVDAKNGSGTSANSSQVSAVPTAVPPAPTGLVATPGAAQVALTWNASTGATAYDVKRSTVNGSGYATVSSPTVTNYTNTGLTNGTTYYFVVDAKNASGTSANSSQASATPVAIPAAPTGLTPTPGNAQVALTWNASTNATAYDVKRSTVSGSGYATVSSPATTSYTNTGLTNGTTYYYVVDAKNGSGTSANSSQVSATPSAGDASQYNFEAGIQGFTTGGSVPCTVTSSTTQAFLGTHSLAVAINGTAAGQAEIHIGGPTAPANAVITYHVWVPTGAPISNVTVYILGGSPGNVWTGAGGAWTGNAWNTYTVTVPASGSAPLGSLGVDFNTSAAWTGTCYVDAINW